MSTYLAGPQSPSLLRDYDRKKAENAKKSGEAPQRRDDETENEYSQRVRRYALVAGALDKI